MRNKLGYLGLLGLLGILGVITDNKAFLGFFGFLVYFRYFTVIPDELFKDNVKKAATHAFFVGIVITSITIALTALFEEKIILLIGLLINFSVSIFIFTILLVIYEIKESRSE